MGILFFVAILFLFANKRKKVRLLCSLLQWWTKRVRSNAIYYIIYYIYTINVQWVPIYNFIKLSQKCMLGKLSRKYVNYMSVWFFFGKRFDRLAADGCDFRPRQYLSDRFLLGKHIIQEIVIKCCNTEEVVKYTFGQCLTYTNLRVTVLTTAALCVCYYVITLRRRQRRRYLSVRLRVATCL